MSRWRDIGVILLLFGLLAAFTVFGPGASQPSEAGPAGSTHTSGDGGALALQRWLRSLGYQTANLEYTDWQIPDRTAALFILAPTEEPILEEEVDEILRWVRAGGTLIAVDDRPQRILTPNRLWEELGVTAIISETDMVALAERATVAQPVLWTPPVESVPVSATGSLAFRDAGFVTLLQTEFGPTFVGRQEGRGYLYVGVSSYPFTNAGLRQPGSGALVLNLLARVPRDGLVLFDEYHHGFTSESAAAAPSLREVALRHWWGWAGLYAAGVTGFYLVLTGRRFGRPIPLQRDVARRSSAEYVQSLADLLRRGRKQQPVAQHFHDAIKRRLARPYGFVPPSEDAAFVQELVGAGGATEEQAAAVRQLLAGLSRPDIDDADLIRLVGQADQLIDGRGRLRHDLPASVAGGRGDSPAPLRGA